VWRKLTISEKFTMAMAEYAWTSFNSNAKVFEHVPQDNTGQRFHPTQKPVALYAWIFSNYAKPGDKILDTHLGSGSSRIAAYDAGLDFVGYEIDKEYFEKEEERFERHTSQLNMFVDY
jgi:site-specific DNA-methyltransferase (adenine-specific)